MPVSKNPSNDPRKLGHELNNAIAPIMLYAGILKTMIKDEKAAAMLDSIELSAKLAAGIAEKLLAVNS